MKPHPRFLRLIDRLFVEGLPPRSFRRLRGHTDTCPACHAELDRVMAVAAFLERGALPAALADQVEHAIARAGRPAPRTPARSFVLSIAPAGALAVLVLLLFALPMDRDATGFGARGSQHGAQAPAVRAFCVGHDESGRAFVRGAAELRKGPALSGPDLSCTIRDHLQFAYRRAALKEVERWSYLFIVGLDEDLEPLWYKPRPPHLRSLRLEGDRRTDVVLSGPTRLSVNHHPGLTQVIAIHSRAPIEGAVVARAARRLRSDRADLRKLTGLPLAEDVVQRTLLVRIEP